MPKSPFFGNFSQLVLGLATAVVHGLPLSLQAVSF